MTQPYLSEEQLEQKKKELIEELASAEIHAFNYTGLEEYEEQIKREYQERINYYVAESKTPLTDYMNYTRKDKRNYKKWLKQKRKERIKAAKEWTPWDACHIYRPLKQTLLDMFEFYKNNIWVLSSPLGEDTRKQTLAQALEMLEVAEYEEEFGDYELSQQEFRIAFGYIAEHMKEWWD